MMFTLMGRNSFAFGFNVEFFTCAVAAASGRSPSSPPGLGPDR